VPADPSAPASVSAVPRRLRILCAVAAAVVVAVMLVVALLLKTTADGVVTFRTSDQVAVAGLGLLLGAGILALGRPRVDADAEGIRVRNVLRHELPWSAVREVRFDKDSPWAALRLTNDDDLSVLAIQAVDGERAVLAIEGLRALHAAARQRDAADPGPPLLHD
jgi:hypothetical protein